jgi:nucleoid-associated protein YgaU
MPLANPDYCSSMMADEYSFMTLPSALPTGPGQATSSACDIEPRDERPTSIQAGKYQRPRNDKVRVHPASPVETVAVP